MKTLKVGMKVRITNTPCAGRHEPVTLTYFNPRMEPFRNKLVTISHVGPRRSRIKEDRGAWAWDNHWLEPVESCWNETLTRSTITL